MLTRQLWSIANSQIGPRPEVVTRLILSESFFSRERAQVDVHCVEKRTASDDCGNRAKMLVCNSRLAEVYTFCPF
jgi:hypothetical protein